MRDIDLSAIRARLAGQKGPAFWRSLEEVAETPEFQAMLHREFPRGGVRVHRSGRPPRLPAPDGRVDRARRRRGLHPPADRADRSLRQGARGPRSPASRCSSPPRCRSPAPRCPCWSRATWAGRPRSSRIRSIRFTRGGTDLFAQASILDLYDPDRSQTVMGKGEIRPWSELSLALTSAGAGQRGAGGAGLRILSGAVTSPTLAAQIQRLLTAAPQAKWIQYEAIGCDNARAGARQAFGEYVEPVYRIDQTDVILSLDADLLDAGPGKLRYARDFAARRRVVAGPDRDDPALRRREHPDQHRLEGRPPAGPEGARHPGAGASDRRRPRRRRCRRSGAAGGDGVRDRGRQGSPGASRPRPGRRRRPPAARRPRPGARHERGARQRRHHRRLHADAAGQPRRRHDAGCATWSAR